MMEPLGHPGLPRVTRGRQHGQHGTKDTIILGTSQFLSFVPLDVRALVSGPDQEPLQMKQLDNLTAPAPSPLRVSPIFIQCIGNIHLDFQV